MLRSFWNQSSLNHLEEAEKLLLKKLKVKSYDTPVGEDLHIHTLEGGAPEDNTTPSSNKKSPLILCHGYGQGAAAFYMNLPQLCDNLHVFAKDWMGYGISSRPSFNHQGVEATEEHFISHMDIWRATNKIEKMILCGHSLGGYLVVAYAERYPQFVEKLILVSPVGVPKKPTDFDEMISKRPFKIRSLMGFASWLWEKGVTPGDMVRCFGPLGKKIVEGYAQRRFRDEGELDKVAFGEYLYHNAAATYGSGERALNELLYPFAWAKKPLCDRIPNLDPKIPIHFIYGTEDWMDHRYAVEVQKTASIGQTISVETIEGAGHQVFLDKPFEFNASVLKACGVINPILRPFKETNSEEIVSKSVEKNISNPIVAE